MGPFISFSTFQRWSILNAFRRWFQKSADKHQKTWISQQAAVLEKRQCTLQVRVQADGKRPRIAVVFWGKGKRVCPDEKAAWYPDVDVLWQENGQLGNWVWVNWVNTTLKPVVKNHENYDLFVDNLTAQHKDDFKKAVSDLKGVVWCGLKNATDLVLLMWESHKRWRH